MTLIKSISGIRGTIGGNTGDNLTPLDVVKFTAAFASIIKDENIGKDVKFVVGRDARISGQMVENLVVSTLSGMGVDVVNTGLSTTPTVEIAVVEHKADGGIIITASHNPKQWNALKLLNGKGEFISDEIGKKVLELAGIKDVWGKTSGQTKTRMNLAFACFEALKKLTKTKTPEKFVKTGGVSEGRIETD